VGSAVSSPEAQAVETLRETIRTANFYGDYNLARQEGREALAALEAALKERDELLAEADAQAYRYEAQIDRAEAELARLREALREILDSTEETGWTYQRARSALANDEKEEA
jgi:chromosome segregation ATPase